MRQRRALGSPDRPGARRAPRQPAYASRTDLIVVSFSDQLLQVFHDADAPPYVALAPGIQGVAGYAAGGVPPVPDVAAFQVPPKQNGLAVPEMLLSPHPSRDAHGDGYAVHVWPNGDEPDGEASYARLIALGIDGYMSSQPSRLHAFLCANEIPRPNGSDRCPNLTPGTGQALGVAHSPRKCKKGKKGKGGKKKSAQAGQVQEEEGAAEAPKPLASARGEISIAARVTGISELVLEVSDLDAARHFYREVLGFEETLYGEGREGRYWYLIGETARLGLWTEQVGLAGGRGGAHVHFAFHVADAEIDRLLERLGAGTEVEGPIQLGPGRAIYVTDPDGNVVEFWSQDMAEYAQGARAGGGPGTFKPSA